MAKLRGIIPVTMSPIHKDGSIDIEGYHKMLDFMLGYPVGGFWILGSASEDFLIPYDQRVEITRVMSEYVDGRVPIIVGSAFLSIYDTFSFFDDTAGMKISGYHHLPSDKKMEARLATRHLTMVADRCPKPLWLYNNETKALKIPLETIRDLSSHPNVAGIKVAGSDLKYIVSICKMQSDEFQVLGSGGDYIIPFLALGVTAHTVSPACMFPAHFCEIYDLWQEGKTEQAREKAFHLGNILHSMWTPRKNTEYSTEEKLVLEILGICKRYVYPPWEECGDEEKEKIQRILMKHGLLDLYRQ